MKIRLAALSAMIALTALCGHAFAGSRIDRDRSDTVVFQIDDRDAVQEYRYDVRSRGYDDVLPERRIVRSLIRRGFVSIEEIRLRRDRYIVEAVRPNGALVRLVIDAYDGEIIDRERIGWVRDRGRRGARDGWRAGGGAEFNLGIGGLGIYSR